MLTALKDQFRAIDEEYKGQVNDENGTRGDLLVEVGEGVICGHEYVSLLSRVHLIVKSLLVAIEPSSHAAI